MVGSTDIVGSEEEPMGQARDVLDRVTTLAVDEHNLESALDWYANDAVIQTPDAGEVRGREGIADYWRELLDALPDSHYEPIAKHETERTAIDEGYLIGTNTGPLSMPSGETLPATGRSVRLRGCDVATVENGRIIEHRIYFDQAEFLEQLGLA
jgi:hypothetical protein